MTLLRAELLRERQSLEEDRAHPATLASPPPPEPPLTLDLLLQEQKVERQRQALQELAEPEEPRLPAVQEIARMVGLPPQPS